MTIRRSKPATAVIVSWFLVLLAAGESIAEASTRLEAMQDQEAQESTELSPLSDAGRLAGLANQLTQKASFAEAHRHYERALAIYEKLIPEDPPTAAVLHDFGLSLFYHGQHERAQPLLERSLAIREKKLGAEHRETISSMNTLATLLGKRGQYEQASRLFERAFAISEEARPEDDLTASLLSNFAGVLTRQGKYERAEQLSARSVAIREKVLGPNHVETATSLSNYGVLVNEAFGDLNLSRQLLERAHKIFEESLGADHYRTLTVYQNLAGVLKSQGDEVEARRIYEHVLSAHEKTFGPSHQMIALHLSNLAVLLMQQGHDAEALPLLERALGILEKTMGPGHPTTAAILNNLGGVLNRLGATDRGREYVERALVISERSLGPWHPKVAGSLSKLAGFLLEDRSNPQKARELIERVNAIHEKTLGPSHLLTSHSLNGLASISQADGQFVEALRLFERSLSIRKTNLSPGHPKVVSSLYQVSTVLTDLERLEDAWARIEEAVQSSELRLRRLLWSETESERLESGSQRRFALWMQLSLARALNRDDTNRLAYKTLLRSKGVVSRSLLQSRESFRRRLPPTSQPILDQLEGVQKTLSKVLFNPPRQGGEAHRTRLDELRKRRSRLERELQSVLGPTIPGSTESVSELRAALPEGSAFVDFYNHSLYRPASGSALERDRWTPMHLSAWVVRADTPDLIWLDLGPSEAIQKAVSSLRQRRRAEGSVPAVSKEANASLRAFLWKPISKHVQGIDTIFISPDTYLGTLPFEVIQREDESYLIEHHGFVYLQDMASLPRIVGQASKAGSSGSASSAGLLCVGGVDYENRGVLAKGDRADNAELHRGFDESWRPLPGTDHEAASIARLHRAAFENEEQTSLRGPAATEERLKSELARHRIVHIATHGFFEPEGLPSMWERAKESRGPLPSLDPSERRLIGQLPGLLSGLVFAGANRPPQDDRDDGFLTAEEISWLDLSGADLIVLSACETGLGSPRSGEGMLGLRRTFRQAGAKTVISSLWSVKDSVTNELMQNFYRRLWSGGEGKLEALRHAQLDLLKKNRKNHQEAGLPATWGAFVLDGDWR